MSKEAMKLARQIIWRYRHETPLGNQPHMIAHEADEAIERIDQALAKQEQSEPVALKVYRGELCYKSQADDQSFGMWCPVTQDFPFLEGTKFYTTPQQRKPLTDEHIKKVWGIHDDDDDPTNIVYERDITRAIETAHGIKE